MQVFKYITVKGSYHDEWWKKVESKLDKGYEPCAGQPTTGYNYFILLRKPIQKTENIKKGFE